VALAETALRNCSAIADYVRKISGSVANEIDERSKMVAQSLEDVKKTQNLKTLHEWYRTELAPLFNKVEQEEHLVSSMRKKKA
jgi:translation initiation factor 2 alpha subunit (eIF-2alpha)